MWSDDLSERQVSKGVSETIAAVSVLLTEQARKRDWRWGTTQQGHFVGST